LPKNPERCEASSCNSYDIKDINKSDGLLMGLLSHMPLAHPKDRTVPNVPPAVCFMMGMEKYKNKVLFISPYITTTLPLKTPSTLYPGTSQSYQYKTSLFLRFLTCKAEAVLSPSANTTHPKFARKFLLDKYSRVNSLAKPGSLLPPALRALARAGFRRSRRRKT
jgi:hypothetical protein